MLSGVKKGENFHCIGARERYISLVFEINHQKVILLQRQTRESPVFETHSFPKINYAIQIKLVPWGSDQEEVTNLRHLLVIHITYIYSAETHVYLCQIVTPDIPSCFSHFTIYDTLLVRSYTKHNWTSQKVSGAYTLLWTKYEQVLVPLTREESHDCTIYYGIDHYCTLL